jgi:hypothetical protein
MQVRFIFCDFHSLMCNIDSAVSCMILENCVTCLQEPKAKDDSQLCSSINYYINRPFGKYFCVLSPLLAMLLLCFFYCFFYLASAFISSHLHNFIKKTSISQKDHIRLIGFLVFYFLFIYFSYTLRMCELVFLKFY